MNARIALQAPEEPGLSLSADVDGTELEVTVGLTFSWDVDRIGLFGDTEPLDLTSAQIEAAGAYWSELTCRLEDALERTIYGRPARDLEQKLLPAVLPLLGVIEQLISQQLA